MSITFPAREQDRYLFVGAALGIALVVFAGFARTYYLKALFGTPALPWLLHVHGVVMSSWIVLFFAQAFLIEKHRVDLHRRLGMVGAVLAVVIVVLGMFLITHAAAREVRAHSQRMHGFLALLALDPSVLLVFATMVASAIALRHSRSDWHKRLMLLATLSLTTVAISRLPFPSVTWFWIVWALLLIVPLAIDTMHHRRLHPVFGWGAPFLFVSLHAVFTFAHTPAWQHFAERLVS